MQVGNARIIATLAIIIAAPCSAQSSASLAISAGSATDVTGVGSTALTVAPSLTRSSGLASATLGASATKFANDAWSAGLSTALSGRSGTGTLVPAIDVALSAATTSYDFSYASADLVPSLEARAGKARVFGGARLAAAGASSMLGVPVSPIPGGQRATTSSTAATAIGGVSVSTVTTGGEVASIGYRGETGRIAGVTQSDHGISAAVANSKLMVAATVGRRDRSAQATMHGSATVGVAMTPVVMLQVSAGNYPANAMLGTAAGKFVNAGLSMQVGHRAGSMPVPSNICAPARGKKRVAIPASDPRRVELAGDFHKWKPIAGPRAQQWACGSPISNFLPGEKSFPLPPSNEKNWAVPEGVPAPPQQNSAQKSAWFEGEPPPKNHFHWRRN